MDTSKEKYYDIMTGPDKDTLFDACKYACSNTVKFPVDFDVAIGYTMPKDNPGCAYVSMAIIDIKILSIEHGDGSGESFNIHGYCKADLNSFGGNNLTYRPYRFKAYYSTRWHEGTITFTEQ